MGVLCPLPAWSRGLQAPGPYPGSHFLIACGPGPGPQPRRDRVCARLWLWPRPQRSSPTRGGLAEPESGPRTGQGLLGNVLVGLSLVLFWAGAGSGPFVTLRLRSLVQHKKGFHGIGPVPHCHSWTPAEARWSGPRAGDRSACPSDTAGAAPRREASPYSLIHSLSKRH